MKKSENISKYSLEWQLCRISIKGSKFSCDEKISTVLSYYKKEPSLQRWERVYNFLEGLQRGYRAAGKELEISNIQESLKYLNSIKVHSMSVELDNWDVLENEVTLKIAVKLYKDLFTRSKKWLLSGYFHKEQEAFIDKLHEVIASLAGDLFHNTSFSVVKLKTLRDESVNIKNKHKFFF